MPGSVTGQGTAGQGRFEGGGHEALQTALLQSHSAQQNLISYTLNRGKISGFEGWLLEETRNVFLTKWAQCSAAKSYCPWLRGAVS